MLQAANTDLFKPLVPKAHNSECQNLFPLQITFNTKIPLSQNKSVKVVNGFLFFAPSASALLWVNWAAQLCQHTHRVCSPNVHNCILFATNAAELSKSWIGKKVYNRSAIN